MAGSARAAWLAAVWLFAGCAEPAPGPGTDLDGDRLRELGQPGRAAGSHVLLISVDTLRADRLGCYGYADAGTPNLDALADAGVRFDQTVCAAPITLPSHTTLLTGLDPPSHGVRLNGSFRLADGYRTLAETLQEAGYSTAAVVAAFVLDARYGLAQGFEHYDDEVPAEYTTRPANEITDAAAAWLEGQDSARGADPFFLWVHYYDPHFPYEPPSPYREQFPGRPYDAEIARTDNEIGRLIDVLRRRGDLDDTLIVLVGDHGEGLGQHGEQTHLDLIYDSTMRVPLIFSNPRLFGTGGVVRDRVAGLVDVVPTVLDLLGVDRGPAPLDGRNVMTAGADPQHTVYIESLAGYLEYGWAALHGLRRRGDKLIHGPDPEYFDLLDDPDELNNRYLERNEASELEAQLGERLREWPADSAVRGTGQEIDPAEFERLAALGYVRSSGDVRDTGADPKAMMHVEARVQRVIDHSTEGDLPAALREIEGVLAEYPDAPRALYMATGIYDRLERYSEGEATMRRAVALAPKSEGWVHLAWYAMLRRDFDAFEAALAQAERLDPLDGQIYVTRGQRAALDGRFDEALQWFSQAIEIDPVRAGQAARDSMRQVEAARPRR